MLRNYYKLAKEANRAHEKIECQRTRLQKASLFVSMIYAVAFSYKIKKPPEVFPDGFTKFIHF